VYKLVLKKEIYLACQKELCKIRETQSCPDSRQYIETFCGRMLVSFNKTPFFQCPYEREKRMGN
jgi:hypothetical protein